MKFSILIALAVLATAPGLARAADDCKKSETTGKDGKPFVAEVCLKRGMFAHDIYEFRANGKTIFKDIDDKAEAFTVRKRGVEYRGGCKPVLTKHKVGNIEMPIEVARNCRIETDQAQPAAVEFKFE